MKSKSLLKKRKGTKMNRNILFRVKPFYFDYNPAFIADVQERVKFCREYISELIK